MRDVIKYTENAKKLCVASLWDIGGFRGGVGTPPHMMVAVRRNRWDRRNGVEGETAWVRRA